MAGESGESEDGRKGEREGGGGENGEQRLPGDEPGPNQTGGGEQEEGGEEGRKRRNEDDGEGKDSKRAKGEEEEGGGSGGEDTVASSGGEQGGNAASLALSRILKGMSDGNVADVGEGCMVESARVSSMSDQEAIVEGRKSILSELQQACTSAVGRSKGTRVVAKLSMAADDDHRSSLCALVLASKDNSFSLAFAPCSVLLALADEQKLVEVCGGGRGRERGRRGLS
eukprot:169601-Hanusia_phi.AAC.1